MTDKIQRYSLTEHGSLIEDDNGSWCFASRISQQDAELERLRSEVEEAQERVKSYRGIIGDKSAAYDTLREAFDLRTKDAAEARKAAFIEAGQKALEWAAHYSPASDGRNTFVLFSEWAEAKAEETRT